MLAASVDVNGTRLLLDPSGALFWRERALLAIADLHLEKGSAFARRGALLPPYDTQATLEQLARTVRRFQPRTVVCLGDSFHDTGGPGRPLVLANGLGGPFKSWRHQIDYLSDRYRLVSWDYRGLYGSSAPTGDPPRLGVEAHVDDLTRVLEAVGVSRAAFMGWSMGVQVILELYERRPELVSHLILVNGTFGRCLCTSAETPG